MRSVGRTVVSCIGSPSVQLEYCTTVVQPQSKFDILTYSSSIVRTRVQQSTVYVSYCTCSTVGDLNFVCVRVDTMNKVTVLQSVDCGLYCSKLNNYSI